HPRASVRSTGYGRAADRTGPAVPAEEENEEAQGQADRRRGRPRGDPGQDQAAQPVLDRGGAEGGQRPGGRGPEGRGAEGAEEEGPAQTEGREEAAGGAAAFVNPPKPRDCCPGAFFISA